MGKIIKVSGPLVVAEEMKDANMFDVVRVSNLNLIGEVIEMRSDRASIQVYEETAGLGPGEPVVTTGAPLSVELGPGLIEKMFDGIQRPLALMREKAGSNITRGIQVNALDRNVKWEFVPDVKVGDEVAPGDIIGHVDETVIVRHKIMVPMGVSGKITDIKSGQFTVEDTVATVQTSTGEYVNLTMMQKWPVRVGRPYNQKLPPEMPSYGAARYRHAVSHCKGRRCGCARPRQRENSCPAPACKMGGCGYCGIYRLRRARKRDDRRSYGIPRAEGP